MVKFFKDIISTLYAPDGGMSIFRMTFFFSFVVFMAIAVADFCAPNHTFEHYGELSIFVGSLGGLCCGNKIVDFKGASKSDE